MLRDWRGGRKAAKEGRGEGGGVDRGWGEKGDSGGESSVEETDRIAGIGTKDDLLCHLECHLYELEGASNNISQVTL